MSRVFHVTESKMENEDEHDELCIAAAVVVAVVCEKKEDGHAHVGFANGYT